MAADDTPKRGLGRGLSALLGDETEDYASLDKLRLSKSVPIEFLKPGRFQPRKSFQPEAIAALVDSIRAQGILQPLLVRRDPDHPNEYEIIAGERRWRAAQQAALSEVPVIVKELSDGDALAIALIENIQREDLTPIEEAAAFQRLMDEFDYTQEALSQTVGKSRSHIANAVRLLTLPATVQTLIDTGAISAGHGRALIGAGNPDLIAEQVMKMNLTVRQTETMVAAYKKKVIGHGTPGAPAAPPPGKDPDIAALEHDLSNLLGLKVSVTSKGESGTLAIRYDTLEQLDDVLHRLTRGKEGA